MSTATLDVPLDGSTTVRLNHMTNTLRSFPRPVRTPPTDWAQWADGQIHPLTRGTHFHQELKQARNAFITWAGRHDMHCHTAIHEGKLIIQAWSR